MKFYNKYMFGNTVLNCLHNEISQNFHLMYREKKIITYFKLYSSFPKLLLKRLQDKFAFQAQISRIFICG